MYYLKDGKTPVPGVTTVLKVLNQPYLINWANKLGKSGIDLTAYMETAARKGKLIHLILGSHVTKTAIKPEELDKYSDEEIKEAEKALQIFIKWEQKHDVQIISSETLYISEAYKFCGIIDFYCLVDGKYTIVDFKTNENASYEFFLQVSSYVKLLAEYNLKVDQVLILCVGKGINDNFYGVEEYLDIPSTEFYFKIFEHLLNIYYLKKEIGWK